MESPWKKATDSPSRQLLWELGRLQLSDQERLYERLDQDSQDKESLHREALRRAAAEHEQVRRDAELFRQRLEADEDLRREKQRQDELRELQRLKQRKIEEEAAYRREAAAAEEAARRADEQRKAAQAAAEDRARAEKERLAAEQEDARRRAAEAAAAEDDRKKQAAEAEAQAKQAALEARRKRAEQEAAAKPTPAPAPPAQESQPAAPPALSAPHAQSVRTAEAEHARYLDIWKKLKELRGSLRDQSKSNAALKKAMGDGRRTIRKCIGQLSTSADPTANRSPNVQLRNVIRDGLSLSEPHAIISDYLSDPPANAAGAAVPALLIYFLNIFAKCLVAQFLGEVAVAPNTASAIGITGATIFSQEDFRWNGLPLTDVLIAKLHRVCPVLFGIGGDDRTEAGRRKLGWWWADDAKTVPCTEQQHYDRMTGLGAGFAAMTLRSFKRTSSPYPPWHFWRAMARILNTPPDRVTDTHLVVLKSMIEGNEARVLEFFGAAGLAALRVALTDFPRRVRRRDGVAAKALLLIPDLLKTEKKLYL